MEAAANLRVNQPPIMFRYHRNVNPEVIDRMIDLARCGTGHPAIFNEDLMERWALTRGYSPDDAKRTQAAGCVAMNCTGRFLSTAFMTEVGFMAVPKMMEYALYQGKDAFSQ